MILFKNLLQISKLKLTASTMGVKKIDVGDEAGTIFFNSDTSVDPMQLVRLIQSNPGMYKFSGSDRLRFYAGFDNSQERFDFLNAMLKQISIPFEQ